MRSWPIYFAAAVAFRLCSTAAAAASELLYFQSSDGQSTYGPSQLWPAIDVDSEITDDFELVATIDRVVAGGSIFGTTPEWQGVTVRFYAYQPDGTPGALQYETVLAASDPDLTVNDQGLVDVRLSTPFLAQGRHFFSVQPTVNYWYWWSANTDAPQGQAFYFRDRAAGQTAWQHGDNQPFSRPSADVQFALYGTVTGPGTIASLSASSLARSGYLEIFGSNFGSDGVVVIGGYAAPITDWTGTRIAAYVPEGAPLGSNTVQVVTVGGTSNTISLGVTERQPEGRLHWRLRLEGSYSIVRPARGPDGTVYAIDVHSRLYAVAPDGGVRWVVRGAGNKGLAVGADGTVYVGSESDIKAFHPDGKLRWTFVQTPRAFILLGLALGPDGNLYGVATEGLGVFSLTPAGTLRWNNPEVYRRPIVDYGEIVFGANDGHEQLYFYANDHTRAVRLDNGASVFTIARTGQPVVSPLDRTMHAQSSAYSPAGQLLWSFTFPIFTGNVSAAEMGADGTHYVVNRSFELYALRPNGLESWHLALSGTVGSPNLDPTGSLLVFGRSGTLDQPGFVLAVDPARRQELWRLDLPPEETAVFNPATGQFGFNQYVDTRARFAPDGSVVYLVTAIATGGQVRDRCFLYSIATVTTPENPTGVADLPVGRVFALDLAPNPTRHGTMLRFELPAAATLRVRVYDVAGRLLRALTPVQAPAGRQAIWWDGRDARGARAPAGVFLVRVSAGELEAVAKLQRLP